MSWAGRRESRRACLQLERRSQRSVDLLHLLNSRRADAVGETFATGRSTSSANAHPKSPIRTANSEPGSVSTTCITYTVGNASSALIESAETTSRSVDCPARAMTGS